ncbi:MAG: transcription elongation factor GreB, partial [Proteobacteria bacterium]
REIDRRIRYLQKRLDAVEVVDQQGKIPEQVVFGVWVGITYESGVKKRVRIVGFDETDPAQGYISWQSPMAKALLGLKSGDVATVRTPKGDEELEIGSIEAPEPQRVRD